jgi:site-specific recombinase XerD
VAGLEISHARELYVRWLRVGRDLSPHTVRAYESDIAAFEKHLGLSALVAAIDSDRLIGFIEEQRAAGLAPASIRRRAAGVRGFCRWLLSCRLLDDDPWAGASIPRGRSRRLPRLLTAHELERLLRSLRDAAGLDGAIDANKAVDRPHAATMLLAVALMVATGVRVHETVSIRVGDVDLTSGSVRITGKGRRERQVFLPNDWIRDLTRAYMTTRVALGVAHGQLLFNLHRDPLTAAALRSRLAKAAADAGLPARVTPHMLRHTAATQLIEAGVDIRYIQRLLGHASLSTTEIYTHVSDGALKRVVSDADVLGRVTGVR